MEKNSYCGGDPINKIDLLGLCPTDESISDKLNKDTKLKWLYEDQGISQLPPEVQKRFVDLYYGSTTITTKQACNVFYEKQLTDAGHKSVLDDINKTKGKSIIEKIDNYAKANPGKIQVTQDLYIGQQWANDAKASDVAMVGYYEYNLAHDTTSHYAMVMPSNKTYDENKNPVNYQLKGYTEVKAPVEADPNNCTQKGLLLSQTGATNGIVGSNWAYTGREPEKLKVPYGLRIIKFN